MDIELTIERLFCFIENHISHLNADSRIYIAERLIEWLKKYQDRQDD